MSAALDNVIEADFGDGDEDDTRFARIFAAHEQLDVLFEDPDAAGTPADTLNAMRALARTLLNELEAATIEDFDDEYEG